MVTEPLRLNIEVCLGEDASTDELDDAARLLRRDLVDAGLGDVDMAKGAAVPDGAKSAEAFLIGTLSLNLLPSALNVLMAVIQDWTGRRPGRTLKLAYAAGEQHLELEYDPDKTDVNQVMALLLQAQAATARLPQVAGTSIGGDMVGGDKVSHTIAGGDAIGRDKVTEIHVAPGSTLIINDPALGQAQVGRPPDEPALAAD